MIEPELAKSFVEKLSAYTEYNVNIFDKKGNIIASRDVDRIGSFHEAAYNIIKYHKQVVEIDDDSSYYGAKQGVNLLVTYQEEPVGVVGVTGVPERVREIAWIIKMALETMISHEIQLKFLSQRKNTQNLFYSTLFNEELPSREKLENFAEKLGYNGRIQRTPIMLFFDEGDNIETKQNIIDSNYLGKQDMCWVADSSCIWIMKALPSERHEALSRQKEYLEVWLTDVEESVDYKKAYVGPTQSRLHHYKMGMETCRWLEKNIISESKVIYINKFLREYIVDLVPFAELNTLFGSYRDSLDEEMSELIVENVSALWHNNYNMVKSSEELFIHKNTMAFRVNKIRKWLNLDPLQSSQDAAFLEYLSLFLSKKG